LRRFVVFLLNAFGGVGLLLAALGIYASLSYLVVLRRREIGIRMALGATWQNVAGLLWQQGVLVIGAGAIAGMIGAVIAGGLLQNEVFGVSTYDSVTWAVVVSVLTLTATLAVWPPTRRALKIQPTEALREE
jgi:putative ABC transport system permease protein